MANPNARTALYRFLDAANRLLYSGRSVHPTARALAHHGDKDWYGKVATIKVTWYASVMDAAIAEFVSIATESPIHNRQRPHERGWLPGHGLQYAGRPYDTDHGSGPGCGICSCGATSPVVPTNCARKRWHDAHAGEIRADLLARIASGVGLPQPLPIAA